MKEFCGMSWFTLPFAVEIADALVTDPSLFVHFMKFLCFKQKR